MARSRILQAVAVALATGWIAWLWLVPDQAFFLLFDDSFYYLEIARNIAAGRGSTFDGLHATNGYHPLWMGVCTLLMALGPGTETAPRLLLTGQLLAWAGVVVALLRGSRDLLPGRSGRLPGRSGLLPGLSVLLLGFHPFFLKAVANGMESTAVVVAWAGVLLLATSRDLLAPGAGRDRGLLSLLLTLAFLARTDGGLLCACTIAWVSVQSARQHGLSAGLRAFTQVGLVPAVALAAFLGGNLALFGHPMQVSGELKRVTPQGVKAVMVGAFALVALWRLSVLPRGEGPLSRRLHRVPFVQAALLLHLAYYLGFQTYPRQWYFAPEALFALFLLPGAVAALADKARADAKPGTEARTVGMAVGPLVAVLGLGWLLGMKGAASPGFLPPRLADREAALWANAHLPDDAVLASWDAGLIGWYCDRPVVNLDGVVNSYGFLDALQQGTTAAFLADAGVSHVVNHHGSADGRDTAELRVSMARRFGQDAADGATVLAQWPYEMTASTQDKARGTHTMATSVLALPRAR